MKSIEFKCNLKRLSKRSRVMFCYDAFVCYNVDINMICFLHFVLLLAFMLFENVSVYVLQDLDILVEVLNLLD